MSKATRLLIALFIVLAAIAGYYILPSGKERETSYKTSELNVNLDSASIVKIDITRPGKNMSLENVDGKWSLTSPVKYPANASLVAQLVGGIAKFKVGSLVSSNPEKRSMFQVDSTGTTITASNRAGKSVKMVFGKSGPSYSDVYFRLPESNDVYLGEGLTMWSFNQDVKEWRDKSILTISADSVQEFAAEFKSRNVIIKRDSTRWLVGKDSVASGDVNAALSALASLRADDFIDTSFSPSTKPLGVRLRTSHDVVINFFPVPPDSAHYAVQSSQSPQVFLLSKWTIQQIRKPFDKYIK